MKKIGFKLFNRLHHQVNYNDERPLKYKGTGNLCKLVLRDAGKIDSDG